MCVLRALIVLQSTVPKVLIVRETSISIFWQVCLSLFDSLASVLVILLHRTWFIKPLVSIHSNIIIILQSIQINGTGQQDNSFSIAS